MLHQSQMIKTRNVIIRHFQCPLKHVNRLFILLRVLVSQTLRMVKLRIGWHYLYRDIKVSVSFFYFLKGQVSISPVEKCSGIIGVQSQCFIVLNEWLIILFVVIKGQGFIVVVCGLISIELDGLLKPFQSQVILLVFKVTQTQIVLGRSVIFDDFTGFWEVSNRSWVVFDLSVTISSVEKGLEMGLPALDVLDSFSKIGYCIIEVHEPRMNETSIEVIDSIVWFQGNCFLKLSQGIIDLV